MLGLEGDESAAYRALVGVPSAGAAELAANHQGRHLVRGRAARSLEGNGLAVRSLGDPDRFVAAPPATMLRDALRRRRLAGGSSDFM